MLTLKVFLSSPGDVADERQRVAETLRAIESGPLLRERVNLVLVSWDDPAARAPLDARESPQQSVNRWAGRPADCDLTLVILWSRLGTPLPAGLRRSDGSRFASGTVWEVEDAIAANRPVFVYRRTDKPRIELDDPEFDAKRAQYRAVQAWFESLRDADGAWRAGVNDYSGLDQFQQLLRAHVEAFIVRRLADDTTLAAASPPGGKAAPAPAPHGSASAAAAAPSAAAVSRGARGKVWLVPAALVLVAIAASVALNRRAPPVADHVAGTARTGQATAEPTTAVTATPTSATTPAIPTEATQAPQLAPPANPPAVSKAAASAAAPTAAAPGALPQVQLAGMASARFTGHRPSTYTVLSLAPEAGSPQQWRLRLRMRLTTEPNGGDMNFWDASFRLLIDGVPRAPDSHLNELVPSGASKDGDLSFDVPWGTQTLALRISHYGKTAELPLALSGSGPPRPRVLPAGPRAVSLDGPAELRFANGPAATYTVLGLASEPRRPGVFGLRLWVRKAVQGGDANFWDAQFRLLVDGVPRAPDSNLNELVDSGAAKDADVTFEVPDDARRLVLRVLHTADQVADVPIVLQPKP